MPTPTHDPRAIVREPHSETGPETVVRDAARESAVVERAAPADADARDRSGAPPPRDRFRGGTA